MMSLLIGDTQLPSGKSSWSVPFPLVIFISFPVLLVWDVSVEKSTVYLNEPPLQVIYIFLLLFSKFCFWEFNFDNLIFDILIILLFFCLDWIWLAISGFLSPYLSPDMQWRTPESWLSYSCLSPDVLG